MRADDDEDDAPAYEFGWWPEIFGAAFTAAVIWFLIAFARGSV